MGLAWLHGSAQGMLAASRRAAAFGAPRAGTTPEIPGVTHAPRLCWEPPPCSLAFNESGLPWLLREGLTPQQCLSGDQLFFLSCDV